MARVFSIGLMLGLAACHSGERFLVNGAGSTFAAPLYTRWAWEFHRIDPRVEVNYQSIGSGGGIQQVTVRTVDFGASDAFLTPAQREAAPGLLNLPTVLGAVAVTANLPELAGRQLRLGPEALAGIFLGDVTSWSDPRIAAENPGVAFPNRAVVVAHRSDGSGTTAIFTDYLSKISPEWRSRVGSSTAVRWPVGLGGKGSEGVAGIVQQNPGAIGYVELSYANENHLPVFALRDRDGKYLLPTIATTSAAAAGVTMPDDFAVSITDAPGEAYPIAGFTYLLIRDHLTGRKAKPMLAFWRWSLTEGEKLVASLGYAPLPPEVQRRVLGRLSRITVDERAR